MGARTINYLIAANKELLSQSYVASLSVLYASSKHSFVHFYLTGECFCLIKSNFKVDVFAICESNVVVSLYVIISKSW